VTTLTNSSPSNIGDEPQLTVMPCWVVADHNATIASVEFGEAVAPLGGAVFAAAIVPLEANPSICWSRDAGGYPAWLLDHFADADIDASSVIVAMMFLNQDVEPIGIEQFTTSDGVLYIVRQ